MNFNAYPKLLYKKVSFTCKMCGEPTYFETIPIGNLEKKVCIDCMRIYRRDQRNRRKAKLSLKA